MIIYGAWSVNELPHQYILDIPGVGLRMVNVTPFRTLTDADLLPYNGYDPRKMRGVPMPDNLYRFYGLEKSKETATEAVFVRLRPSDRATLEQKAKAAGMGLSEYMRRAALWDGKSSFPGQTVAQYIGNALKNDD